MLLRDPRFRIEASNTIHFHFESYLLTAAVAFVLETKLDIFGKFCSNNYLRLVVMIGYNIRGDLTDTRAKTKSLTALLATLILPS